MRALPNIFHGTTVLGPGEAGNKNANWTCEGRTQFFWLRHAKDLMDEEDTRGQRALAIATALQALDADATASVREEDTDQTDYWQHVVAALYDAIEAGMSLRQWDVDFVVKKVTAPPSAFSPKQREQLRRMATDYLGERV